jgi:hypothetical protein
MGPCREADSARNELGSLFLPMPLRVFPPHDVHIRHIAETFIVACTEHLENQYVRPVPSLKGENRRKHWIKRAIHSGGRIPLPLSATAGCCTSLLARVELPFAPSSFWEHFPEKTTTPPNPIPPCCLLFCISDINKFLLLLLYPLHLLLIEQASIN